MSDSKLQSLAEIFNQRLFRIPDFQRGYSWQEKQLEDFWEDIQNLKGERVHYTGVITVEPIAKIKVEKMEKWLDDIWLFERGLKAYYVIDGQQRLTTSIIFIQELLNRFEEDDWVNFEQKKLWVDKFLFKKYRNDYMSFVFGYEKDNPSDEYFKTKILGQKSMSADKVPEQTLYTANLQFAKDFFFTKFNNSEVGQLENWFKKVIYDFKFNFYTIDDDLDVFVTFETMNNRGKPLSNLELLKNRLIYLSTLLNEDSDSIYRLRKDINECWKTVYEYLGRNKEEPLDDDFFLYNHWIMYFKYDRNESESYARFLLNEMFTARAVLANQLTISEIKEYIESLSVSVRIWYYLHNPGNAQYSEETMEWLQKLNRLGMGAFAPLLMAVLSREADENKILKLIKTAERFVFLVFTVSQRSSQTKNSHFYRLASSYYHKLGSDEEYNINWIINDIETNTDGKAGEGETYVYHGFFDLAKFKVHMDDLHLRREGFYSWKGLKYFLYEYELFLQIKVKESSKVGWREIEKRKMEETIEHIYPRNDNETCWSALFLKFDLKQRVALLHSLGNLLLLAKAKNSELQNKCFDYKCKRENRNGDLSGYFNGSHSEIEVSACSKWTASEILERGKTMLKFMALRWNIDFEDWGYEEEDLLGISFVKNILPVS